MEFTNKEYKYNFNDGDINVLKLEKGLSKSVVKKISTLKDEDD